MRRRLHIAALLVLVFALAIGAGIYLGAGDSETFDPSTSKMYVRELQRFGGRASVLFDELNRWFAARWRGRELGITIACLGAAAALVLAAIARRAPK